MSKFLVPFALLAVSTQAVDTTPLPITGPWSGTLAKTNDKCSVTWDLDKTGQWTNTTLSFMTGCNFDMKKLHVIATGIDATKVGSFEYTCPAVFPNSAIYFIQAENGENDTKSWSTRFAVRSETGTDPQPPEHSTQKDVNGKEVPIPCGDGALMFWNEGKRKSKASS